MEPQQIIALIGSSLAVGVTLTKLFNWACDAHKGHARKRRAEVDRAITERDKAIERAEAAGAAENSAARHARIVEESLHVHRRLIIDAPCLGPSHLPPYPSRKD